MLEMHAGINEIRMTVLVIAAGCSLLFTFLYIWIFYHKKSKWKGISTEKEKNRNKGAGGGGILPSWECLFTEPAASYLVKVLDSGSPSGQQVWFISRRRPLFLCSPCEALGGFSFLGTGNCRGCFFCQGHWPLTALPCNETVLSPNVIYCWHHIATYANGQIASALLALAVNYLTPTLNRWKSLARLQTLCLQVPLLPSVSKTSDQRGIWPWALMFHWTETRKGGHSNLNAT